MDTRKRVRLSFILALLPIAVAVFYLLPIQAGPTIIRDNRIDDTALTPVLGRGYTIVTNTFQSKCLDNVVMTEPSYDFQYKFESMETMSDVTHSASSETSVSGKYGFFSGSARTAFSYSGNTKLFFHRVLVTLNMDTYYASVDEAKSRISASAAKLLQANDIPGFFMGCGSYYIRSIGRNAKFVSLFTYQDQSESRDANFEADMQVAVSGFGSKDACPGSELQECASQGTSTGLSGSASQKVTYSFKSQVASKRLTIETHAYGLGKNEGATLISYDLETFKAAIKDAFISMQNPATGKVKNMEIVPWVENTEFQASINLEQKENPAGGAPLLMYEKKYNLNLNGEFLGEIDRADRNLLNIYYKAKICKEDIETNYMTQSVGGGQGQWLPGYDRKLVFNNKTGFSSTLTLVQLYNMVKEPTPLLDKQQQFMKESQPCIKEMMAAGMFRKSWKQIGPCSSLLPKMAALLNRTVDDHCMPMLVPPPPKMPSPPQGANTPPPTNNATQPPRPR